MTNIKPGMPILIGHGGPRFAAVDLDDYNVELRDSKSFIGDRASNRAFRAILEDWRERLRENGTDPLGEIPSEEISKKKIDQALMEGEPEAAAVVHAAIEEFAQELATVVRRFLRLKAWHDTQRIVVGGGLRESRTGETAIGRAGIILKAEGRDLELQPIRHHPDEAGLIGCVHLAPSWVFTGHDSILAVDIGGSNIRVGVLELNLKKAPNLSETCVWESELWRHADDNPSRDQAVKRMVGMLRDLLSRAEKKQRRVAPFIGIGCPGLIRADGSIKRGGQNLPGNWESKKFNLPHLLREAIPVIDGHEVSALMHNDAVVQGLSEVPFMGDVKHWAILTIGTGLGNAHFTNRPSSEGKKESRKEDKKQTKKEDKKKSKQDA